MRDKLRVPDLSFPDVEFGPKETPWNLSILLYKGGAAAKSNEVAQLIASGALGDPQFDRLELVIKLHEQIDVGLASGGARGTASNAILQLRALFAFADKASLQLSLLNVTGTYCAWADSLVQRTLVKKGVRNLKRRSLSMRSAYNYGAVVGVLLDDVLERHTSILELTRLLSRKHRKTAVGIQAEKQNLGDTFAFGYLLQDICDGLTIEVTVEAPLPVQIMLRSGKELIRHGDKAGSHQTEQETQLRERYPLANLRIEAELFMLVGQTGMNRAQALNLELRHFAYASYLDGYQVKDRKNRREGTVLFEIFKEYKPHFERYLAWRRAVFPTSPKLFPFIGFVGSRQEVRCSGQRLRVVCHQLKIPFVSAQLIRNTRVNWLLRRSGDPNLTAEMAQHTKETLLSDYELPSLQRAMVETLHFWAKADPQSIRTQAVAPGGCDGQPKVVDVIPEGAPKPDCVRASGCLWCENHRDVDSFDYVWALSGFMHIKVLELGKARAQSSEHSPPPAQHAIGRIRDKLKWFEQSNDGRRTWVAEAQVRMNEGDYPPEFRVEIEELEGLE